MLAKKCRPLAQRWIKQSIILRKYDFKKMIAYVTVKRHYGNGMTLTSRLNYLHGFNHAVAMTGKIKIDTLVRKERVRVVHYLRSTSVESV
jgi:hypothetical protein